MSTTEPRTLTGEQRRLILQQTGRMTVLGISGGRVVPLHDGIELPVSQGYKVRIRLNGLDLYNVERVMVRGAKEFPKGTMSNVYAEQLSEVAWAAHAYRNDENGVWEAAA